MLKSGQHVCGHGGRQLGLGRRRRRRVGPRRVRRARRVCRRGSCMLQVGLRRQQVGLRLIRLIRQRLQQLCTALVKRDLGALRARPASRPDPAAPECYNMATASMPGAVGREEGVRTVRESQSHPSAFVSGPRKPEGCRCASRGDKNRGLLNNTRCLNEDVITFGLGLETIKNVDNKQLAAATSLVCVSNPNKRKVLFLARLCHR